MPQLDFSTFSPQLIWLVITFLGLYLLMSRVALPRIGGVIEQRQSKIADDIDAAQSLKNDTDKAIAAYEQALAEARAKAHSIAQETRDALNAEVDAERAKIDAEIAEKVTKAERAIAATKAAAMKDVRKIAGDVAGDIVSQLTGSKITKAAVTKAVGKAAGE
jgi:F-type H+-transporting ATPase subunit b